MLLCLTANHRNTRFEVLDRLSVTAPDALGAIASAPGVQGAVLVATCNRFEAYLDVRDVGAREVADRVLALVARTEGTAGSESGDVDELARSVAVLEGDDVPHHLFAVSSGLESMVVGEDEISGQVARALERARAQGTTTSALERLFQRAAATSRVVRAATDLGGAGRSLVRLALELASSRVTDWGRARVLVVGTGQYAATTIAALRERGAADIRVYSATGRAAMFGRRYGVRPEPDLGPAVGAADVVVTCTARYTVTPDHVPDDERRLVIDLGLPRNVDPAVGALPGVELLDLELIALHAPHVAVDPSDARLLVDEAAAAFGADQTIAPAIVDLRRSVFDVLDAEIERATARGADGRTVEALRHFAGVLLHTPSVRARELARAGRADEVVAALETLFGIRTSLADGVRGVRTLPAPGPSGAPDAAGAPAADAPTPSRAARRETA